MELCAECGGEIDISEPFPKGFVTIADIYLCSDECWAKWVTRENEKCHLNQKNSVN
jgi:hypothetical protein